MLADKFYVKNIELIVCGLSIAYVEAAVYSFCFFNVYCSDGLNVAYTPTPSSPNN